MNAERFYEHVVRVYPRWYRRDRAEEIITVLIDAGEKPSLGQTASLVRHGLSLRVAGPQRGVWRRPLAVATVLLACVVGVMGMQILGSALQARWYQLFPMHASAMSYAPVVDARWPVAVAWVLTMGFVLMRWWRPALLMSWVGVATSVLAPGALSLSSLKSTADLGSDYSQLVFMLPSLTLAILLMRPGRVSEGVQIVGFRGLALVVGSAALLSACGGSGRGLPTIACAAAVFVLHRHHLLLRGTFVLLVSFVWMGLSGLADGSGSRLPHDPVVLVVFLAVLPLPLLLALLVWLRSRETGGWMHAYLAKAGEVLKPGARGLV